MHNRTTNIVNHLALIEMYVQRAREHPAEAQNNLTWIKQAVAAVRRELETAANG